MDPQGSLSPKPDFTQPKNMYLGVYVGHLAMCPPAWHQSWAARHT